MARTSDRERKAAQKKRELEALAKYGGRRFSVLAYGKTIEALDRLADHYGFTGKQRTAETVTHLIHEMHDRIGGPENTWRVEQAHIKDKEREHRATRNKEKARAYRKKWYEENKTRAYDASAQWRKDNLGAYLALQAKRRAAKLQRTPKWLTAEDFAIIRELYEQAKALQKATGIAHEVDHIIPLQGAKVSGLHVPCNLQVLTASKNRQKHNSFDIVTAHKTEESRK